LTKVFPALGTLLLRRALRDAPIGFADDHAGTGVPEVSFLIGHRGTERIPLLLATLRSIAAQEGVGVEAIVVEQDVRAVLPPAIPGWVQHVHTPPPDAALPYSRAWAFNVAARLARGAVLVLHDNDILVPKTYALRAIERTREGADVIDLKRFVFHLSREHTRRLTGGEADLFDHAPEAIVQNNQGASIAVRKESFFAIGGFDEGFVGWGGEDNEFWERARTLRVHDYGCLPFVHLWHPAQAEKLMGSESPTHQRYLALTQRPVADRIAALQRLEWGRTTGPTGLTQ
jgi:hypothetical protein